MFSLHRSLSTALAIIVCSVGHAVVVAEDAYFDIPSNELQISTGKLPETARDSAPTPFWAERNAPWPWVVLEGREEAYVRSPSLSSFPEGIVIRAPKGKDLRGLLATPSADGKGWQQIRFTIPATAAKPAAREVFNRAKLAHYDRLRNLNLPGAAWFRHQANQARQSLGDAIPADAVPRDQFQARNEFELAESYALFSGGRAVSENLQLDRQLLQRGNDESMVGIDTLTGITVTEIDWKPLIKDIVPQTDPLAKLIPADQHVLFVPSVAAALKLVKQMDSGETVVLRLAEPRIEDAGTLARYERQLGVSLRDLPSDTITSLALTGSDPYFRTGTDVAVLMETKQPTELAKVVSERIQNSSANFADASGKTGKVADIAYQGFVTPDRRLSSYVAQLPGAVVVTNSLAQLKKLASIQSGSTTIATLDEYKFFRHRYPRGDKDETGFVFLSDPTIRRWCSPQWRIASSRRTRNAAVLAELQAQHVVAIATGNVEPKTISTDLPMINGGELAITASGVVSSGQGTLACMTPIVETPIQQVTKTEADAYSAWRDGYQSNWSRVFDPIGLRLIVNDEQLSADLTVMPLIAGSDYREYIEVSQGAKIAAAAGDPHGALAHAVLALNTQSPRMQQWGAFAAGFMPNLRVDPLSWLGTSVSLYIDDDPVWQELHDMTPEERMEFGRQSMSRLPIAFHAEVSSPLKLAGFLAGLRAFIEQTGPGLTVWEPLTYRDQAYVRVRATDDAGDDFRDTAIYYSPSAQGLTVTPNEDVLKRAIDRRLARAAEKKPEPAADPAAAPMEPPHPWLGSNFCLQVDRKAIELGVSMQGIEVQRFMQGVAWSNLPILNEWKRRFPDQDPVEVHERLWATRPLCPGGGEYVWNAEWQTMESSVYGHPGEPLNGPAFPTALNQFQFGNFGVTFEDQGLRAQVEFQRDSP